jgi:hypothetical protein
MDTRITSLREVMVAKPPLGGRKIIYEIDTSNSNEELIPSQNLDFPHFDFELVIVAPLYVGVKKLKRREKRERLRIIFEWNEIQYVHKLCTFILVSVVCSSILL